MRTFLRSFNSFTHSSGALLLQKFAAVLKKIPVTAPSFHASTHFHTETPSIKVNNNINEQWIVIQYHKLQITI